MEDTYWAWVAGVVDGEGSYCVSVAERRRPIAAPTGRGDLAVHVKLTVVNTDVRMLDRLLLSGGSVRKQPKRGEWRSTGVWSAGAGWIRACGPSVVPHAVTKAEHLRVILEALGKPGAVRDNLVAIRETLRQLNLGERYVAPRS